MNILKELLTPHMKTERTECSETSAHKIQTPGYHPKERIHEFDLVSIWQASVVSYAYMLLVVLYILTREACLCFLMFILWNYKNVNLARKNSVMFIFLRDADAY